MATASQAAANLDNAQHSTGPRTEAGKAASSHNSLKHGLTAQTVLLPGEDPAAYAAFREGLLHDLAPVNHIELSLATELVDIQWRLNRVPILEARILSADAPDFKALNNISLHAARLKRQYTASLKNLFDVQRRRETNRRANIEAAALIRQADLIHKRPTDLAQFGFDFTLEYVDQWIRDRAALEAARRTVQGNRNAHFQSQAA
jgi:hypothetical protein